MAATKRPVPEPSPSDAFRDEALVRAIARSVDALSAAPKGLAVALSGGADSAMLAVHAARFARERGLALHCLHIHHGLQQAADQWQAHVHDLAQRLRLPCHSVRVRVDVSQGDGMESAARAARYHALAELARQADASHVLLAHHRDDQAETVLLRLLRGAGPTGLAAMAPSMARDGVTYLRPWLDAPRARLLQLADEYARSTGWRPVADPSNTDDQYTRAAVRQRLAPQLDQRWPGWQASLARHARQSREVAQILHEVARQDFAALDPDPDGASFALAKWRLLSPARQALVLRHWLAQRGLRMPSDARLHDLMRQMRGLHALGHDRAMRVRHGGACVCCIRGRVLLE